MKKVFLSIVIALFSISLFAQTPKYVFYVIGDGMGLSQAYLAQQYNKATNGGDINFMNFPVRTFVSTFCANSLVTDSAASGTALATGSKTDSGQLGTLPDGSPVTSLAEMAKKKGLGAGVVTSVGINHATPAAFYAKVKSRNDYDIINQQLIDHNIDFAAGATFLATKGSTVKPEDWVAKAKAAGIEVFVGKDQYKTVKGKRVIYLSENLDRSQIHYEVDIQPSETSLQDFTKGAIDYLSTNFKKGFFLMIEGGLVDGTGHSTDAAACVNEVTGLSKALDIVLDFYAKHPNETLIVVTADHETGGLTMGAGAYSLSPKVLENSKLSKEELSAKLIEMRKSENEVTWSELKDFLRKNYGFWDTIELTADDENRLAQAYKDFFLTRTSSQEKNLYSTNEQLAVAIIKVLEKHAEVTWAFSSHSGIPVPVYVKGVKASSFMGVQDNTDLPKKIKEIARY